MAPVGEFVEEHQLPDVSVGGDLAGEVGLQGGEGAPQDPRQVGAVGDLVILLSLFGSGFTVMGHNHNHIRTNS